MLTVSVLPASTALPPALTPETPAAAETLVPVVETETLFAFACTAPTLPEPEIFAPSAMTVMLSTVPETAMSVFAAMPLPALVFAKFTPLSPPRSKMRPVTVTFERSICDTPSAIIRSPLMVFPASDTLLSRTMRLPSTVSGSDALASA